MHGTKFDVSLLTHSHHKLYKGRKSLAERRSSEKRMQKREFGENYFLCLYGHAIQSYTTKEKKLCKESVTKRTKCNSQTGYMLPRLFPINNFINLNQIFNTARLTD